jgi:lysophospholipase L1-like esterase
LKERSIIAVSSVIVLVIMFSMLALFLADRHNRQIIGYWWQDFKRSSDQTTEKYTLLLGSSSIARLPNNLISACRPFVKYGFENGTTESINTYLRYGNLENLSKVILYIGENDIASKEPPQVTFNQLNNLLNIIQSKTNAPIAIIKLKYSPARQNTHAQMQKFNQKLEARFGKIKQGVQNVQTQTNVASIKNQELVSRISLIPFDGLKQKYLYVQDGVHLNRAGYLKFTQLINAYCEA